MKNEYFSSEYQVLPQYVDSTNYRHGYQYYATFEHMIGVTESHRKMEGRQEYKTYHNKIFRGTIIYEENRFYGFLIRKIDWNKQTHFSCNEPIEPFTTLRNNIKESLKLPYTYIRIDDFEMWLFKELYPEKIIIPIEGKIQVTPILKKPYLPPC